MKTTPIFLVILLVMLLPACLEDSIPQVDPGLAIISDLVPGSGYYGDTIKLTGSQLAEVDSLLVNGTNAFILGRAEDYLDFTVPYNSSTGPVSVINAFGIGIGPDFTVLGENDSVPEPIIIDSISPSEGLPLTEVTIYGSNFGEAEEDIVVYLNEQIVELSSFSDIEIEFIVGENASTGNVSIVAKGDTILGPVFTVLQIPQLSIESINPDSGQELTEVLITGENFGSQQNDIQVTLSGEEAQLVSVSETEIIFIVPDGAVTGPVMVAKISNGQQVEGPVFTVLPPDPVITVTTLAGNTQNDNVGNPFHIVADGEGNYYFTDATSNQIKRVTAAGQTTIYAGTGEQGFTDGNVNQATFNLPAGLTIDEGGNLYVADLGNHSIRRISTDGIVATIAGFGQSGFADGFALQQAQFNQPADLALDGDLLYISDFGNHALRVLNLQTEMVSTIAGNGTPGYVNGSSEQARFNFPLGIALDHTGNILMADGLNNSIRLVNTSQNTVTTVAGTTEAGFADGLNQDARFRLPYEVSIAPNGDLFVADRNNHSIRKISNNMTSTLAGTGTAGFNDGIGEEALFNNPTGLVAVSEIEILICDYSNGRIRRIIIE